MICIKIFYIILIIVYFIIISKIKLEL